MKNIKRCDWCYKEYDANQSDINNPRVFLKSLDDIKIYAEFCSLDCMEKEVVDRIEDRKKVK